MNASELLRTMRHFILGASNREATTESHITDSERITSDGQLRLEALRQQSKINEARIRRLERKSRDTHSVP